MITVLTGSNWFALKKHADTLVTDFVGAHGDLALERVSAQEASYNQILGALESMPFLASKKMVVLHDLSENKEAAERVGDILEKSDETTDLLIIEGKLDKRGVYYKQLKKLDGFREFGELDESGLVRWVQEWVSNKGMSLSANDARYLVQRIGLDQTKLASELEKLGQYSPKITKETINLLTLESPKSTIFNLIDMSCSGNVEGALRLYEEQRALRVEPQAIHGMFVWQMHIVAVCAAGGNQSSATIAQKAGINPYVAGKSQAIARKLGIKRVQEFLELLRDIDVTSKKQTYNYDDAMRYAIVSLGR